LAVSGSINAATTNDTFWLRTLIQLRSVSRLQRESHIKKGVDNRRNGKVDIALYRDGNWFIRRSSNGGMIRDLAQQKESEVEERASDGRDHVHMLLSIPTKYSLSEVVGFIKGKSAIAIARNFMDRAKNFVGQNFWARGYYVSTVGRDEAQIREYIREQEKEDKRLEQLEIFE
jgi:putative transposase